MNRMRRTATERLLWDARQRLQQFGKGRPRRDLGRPTVLQNLAALFELVHVRERRRPPDASLIEDRLGPPLTPRLRIRATHL